MLNSKYVLAALLLLQGELARALPIGFYKNQGPVDYSEIKSDHFYIYHDARTPEEGAMMLNALEAARVPMERWFQESRKKPLPVIMSAISEHASFANLITDALEIQTLGQGTKELVWHEYVHSTMYQKVDNFLGPAGSLIHLPWMPAWYIEGLPEALSISNGSDVTAGIERYQALADDWPSFARLHSLYSMGSATTRGYATSGAMVSHLFRMGDPNKLSQFINDYYRYTMPWWWPWAIVPFNGFLPMDAALKNIIGMNGDQFYKTYKKAAKDRWSRGTDLFLVGSKDKRRQFTLVNSLKSVGDKIFHLNRLDDVLQETALEFDENGWAQGLKKIRDIDDDIASIARVNSSDLQIGIKYDDRHEGTHSTIQIRNLKGGNPDVRITRPASVITVSAASDQIYWLELAQDVSRLCMAYLDGSQPRCQLSAQTPTKIRVIGEKYDGSGLEELWISESTEKLAGTLTKIHVLTLKNKTLKKDVLKTNVGVISAAFAGKTNWLLTAEHDGRVLRRLDSSFNCTGSLSFKDHIIDAFGLSDGSLVLSLYAGDKYNVKKLSANEAKPKSCTPFLAPTSPIQYAVSGHQNADLKTAFTATDFWKKPEIASDSESVKKLSAAKPLDQDVQPGTGSEISSSPAKWRPRPVLLFPWIGADDAIGPQVGIISLPLVDHMQNETVLATFLYGTASNFPYQEVALTSTRFLPTLSLALFRQQTYNGRFYNRATEEIVEGYLDEKGVRLQSEVGFQALGGKASFGSGIKYSHLKPYIGPYKIRKGYLAEPAANLSLVNSFGRLSWSNSISGRVAPEILNEDFDYNQLGAATSLGLATGILSSQFSLGLEGSRTRGKKRREFKEIYRPLKTYIPGSGGGFNKNNFPIVSAGSGLFSSSFGDTQARAKANWTFPVIRDLEKLFWIIYLERLDFTAFYNYGGAWTGSEPARGWDHLTRAHGYSLDLQMENKGVRFNLGLGAGQVIGKKPEVYLTTGFDALF